LYFATSGPGSSNGTAAAQWTKVVAQSIPVGAVIHPYDHVLLTVTK
jgi:hypothetical protein